MILWTNEQLDRASERICDWGTWICVMAAGVLIAVLAVVEVGR